MQTSRLFKTSQVILAKTDLVTNKGELYLEAGGEAQILVYDPVKHPECPYGIRKAGEHSTNNFYSEEQLMASPNHKSAAEIDPDLSKEYYRHPANPRHEELRAQGWRVDPATLVK